MKRWLLYSVCAWFLVLLSGCSVRKIDGGEKREISFVLISEEKIPEELSAKIVERDAGPFKITYSDKGKLYIAQGYGKKNTSGYSVEVISCYETDHAVYVHTNLIGPAKDEKVIQAATSPHVVIQLDDPGKNVVFE